MGRLLAHLPMRHEREEAEGTIGEVLENHIVSARGLVTATRPVRGHKKSFQAVLEDDTGRLDLVWFNAAYLEKKIFPGQRLRVQGKATRRGPGLQIVNPRFEVLKEDAEPEARDRRLRPVYPASEAAPSRTIERSVSRVLAAALPLIEDHLSDEYRKERELPTLAEAYRMLHAPRDEHEPELGRRRLAYDEFLLLRLGVEMKRRHLRETTRAAALPRTAEIDRRVRARLPFALTNAQDRVIGEIAADLAQATPANRLVQGEVGSGKTAVAAYAMLLAVAAGHQAALMAPTEILASQHADALENLLRGSRVRAALLTASVAPERRREILRDLASGELDILIGTHALLSSNVRFASLALAVIDEQHRFGVAQRAVLRSKPGAQSRPAAKGKDETPLAPHVLVLTATPIPRTLALTIFGDLDISALDELPPGRSPVQTRVAFMPQRLAVYEELLPRFARGEQAYIVTPTIEDRGGEDAATSAPGVRRLLRELSQGPLRGARLAALHGRLRPEARSRVMDDFRRGALDALVATSLVEVGLDVPGATAMIVEDADRFGLSQLHQLRGRVGRGSRPGACVLLAREDLERPALDRLHAMETIHNGFLLAQKDLELRGMGEVLGTRQWGVPPFRAADLARDQALLDMARRDAAAWIASSPLLASPHEGTLRRRLLKAHGASLGLGDVG